MAKVDDSRGASAPAGNGAPPPRIYGSAAEREIRDAVAEFVHREIPRARLIHELVVDDCRADLAAVEPERIYLFEIKSAKDKLDRLDRQLKRFSRSAHATIVVAHARWFEEFDYTSGGKGFRPLPALSDPCFASGADLWCHPEAVGRATQGRWTLRRHWLERPEPHAAKLLGLLWKPELIVEAQRHRIACGPRWTIRALIKEMAWLMSGREIALAVCRQLRVRPFPEADAPIAEVSA
jgi:hypothetical protein